MADITVPVLYIWSLSKHLLSAWYVLNTVLGNGYTPLNKTSMVSPLINLTF